jgi:hypothetical protein
VLNSSRKFIESPNWGDRRRAGASSSNVEVVNVEWFTSEVAPLPPACAAFRDDVRGEPPRARAPQIQGAGVGRILRRNRAAILPNPAPVQPPATTAEHYLPTTTSTTPHATTDTPTRPHLPRHGSRNLGRANRGSLSFWC